MWFGFGCLVGWNDEEYIYPLLVSSVGETFLCFLHYNFGGACCVTEEHYVGWQAYCHYLVYLLSPAQN